jgi:tRNA G18 (ribose-2'-O)-methylase SpoU
VFIPMYGKGRSLNVHVALAVLLYHVLHVKVGT